MTTRAQRTAVTALVIAMCAVHAWMAASVSRIFSTTFDEIAHLTAGYAYWTTTDYRFQPENGILPQRLVSLPLLALDVRFPPDSGEVWRKANVWKVGHEFFYESGNDLPAMLAAGRAMNALLSGILCFLIFLWSLEIFGLKPALLALALAVLSPALLAHGGLATSDTAATLGFSAASLAWWRLLHRISIGRLLTAGLCAGLLAVSKFSAPLLAPMALLLLCIRLVRRTPIAVGFGHHIARVTGWRRLPVVTGAAVVTTAVAVIVIWSAYGFRYSAAPPGNETGKEFSLSWDEVLLNSTPPARAPTAPDQIDLRPGPVQHFVAWARNWELLPEAWLYGLTFVEKHSRGRSAYFFGEYSLTGWREFFPTLFLLKTTPATLLLLGMSMAALACTQPRRRGIWLYRIAPLLVLLAVYWAFSIQSKLNIGHRHLLPTYAPIYALTGASLLLVQRHRAWAALLVVLVAWHTRESFAIRPDYLAYFNAIGRGPEQAHRLFVDSSLDWGQDLPRLKTWLDRHARHERVFLSYFGTGSPTHTGIQATRIGDHLFDREPRGTVPSLSAGIYCLSATMLSQIHSPARGPWTAEKEHAYHQLSAWIRHLRSRPPHEPPTWVDGSTLDPSEVSARLFHYEHLLFGRLCHFLQVRRPDALIGYSILIFRLTADEVSLIQGTPNAPAAPQK